LEEVAHLEAHSEVAGKSTECATDLSTECATDLSTECATDLSTECATRRIKAVTNFMYNSFDYIHNYNFLRRLNYNDCKYYPY
jgi:hypothetical protein